MGDTTSIYLGDKNRFAIGDEVRKYGRGINREGSHTVNLTKGHTGEVIPSGTIWSSMMATTEGTLPTELVALGLTFPPPMTSGKTYLVHTRQDLGDTEGGDSGSSYTTMINGVEITFNNHNHGTISDGSHGPRSQSLWGPVGRRWLFELVDGLSYPGKARPRDHHPKYQRVTHSLLTTGVGTCGDTLAPTDFSTTIMPAEFTDWQISGDTHELYEYVIDNSEAPDEPEVPTGRRLTQVLLMIAEITVEAPLVCLVSLS